MKVSRRRGRPIFHKGLREYRRNRSLVGGMIVIPAVFVLQPLLAITSTAGSAAVELSHRHELLYMLAIPYLVYGVFLACVALFAHAGIADALIRGPDVLAQLAFTPLLSGWSIWT